ncbi:putative arabinogalactan endo-beta-1,4-galactanase [Dirofilaria immitis]
MEQTTGKLLPENAVKYAGVRYLRTRWKTPGTIAPHNYAQILNIVHSRCHHYQSSVLGKYLKQMLHRLQHNVKASAVLSMEPLFQI